MQKTGAIFQQNGRFDHNDPEILVKGYGRLKLSQAKQKLRKYLLDAADRARGHEMEYRNLAHSTKHGEMIQHLSHAIHCVYQEFNDPAIKRKITNMKKQKQPEPEESKKPVITEEMTLVPFIVKPE